MVATSSRFWCWFLVVGAAIGGAIPFGIATLHATLGDCASAQITPDGTLGAESSVVTPEDSVDVISGGATRGASLFHSFEQFSVPTGGAAHFNNPINIQNIISRVTGGSVSNIDGLIRANGTANLFLLNPNGIIFGPNASLNIGGSFVATTANAIEFGNQSFFSASNPNTPALLTVNPSAFLFNQIAAAPIQNNSVAPAGLAPADSRTFGLRVPDGRSLLLVGGNISMDDGTLKAYGGQVELGGLAGQGTVGLNFTNKDLSLSFPDNVVRADVSLSNRAEVSVRADNGGSIAINAQDLNMEEARLLAGIDEGLGSSSSIAGNIEINATGIIRLTNDSVIQNGVGPRAVGKSGNIRITTGSIALTNNARLVAATFGQGGAGSIIINARERVSFDGTSSDSRFASAAITSIAPFGVGKGGDIRISTGSLLALFYYSGSIKLAGDLSLARVYG